MNAAAGLLVLSGVLLPHCTGDVSTIQCERGASVTVLGGEHRYNTNSFIEIYHNNTPLANCHGGPEVFGPDSERLEMFWNGSLLIRNLTDTDSGEYTLHVDYVLQQTQRILVTDSRRAEDHPVQDTGAKPRGYRILLLAPVIFSVVVILVLLLRVGACHDGLARWLPPLCVRQRRTVDIP